MDVNKLRNRFLIIGGKKCWYRVFEMFIYFVNLMI